MNFRLITNNFNNVLIEKLQAKTGLSGLTKDDVIIYDSAGKGQQAECMKKAYKVFGGGLLNDKLELDRQFALNLANAEKIRISENIEGFNVSIEGWYLNGELVPDSLNSNTTTGVMWLWKKKSPKLYRHTLALIEPFLQRHKYNGILCAHCLIKKDGLPYLTGFTTSIRYDIFIPIISEFEPVDKFFENLASGQMPQIKPSFGIFRIADNNFKNLRKLNYFE